MSLLDRAPVDASTLAEQAGDLAATALTLARRFAAGATLWCIAPSSPHHARHVAVEFVHPVIMGKRSLPAAALDGADDVVGTARLLVRPGDVVLAVGDADDPTIADLLRRGDAWGVQTVLLATGNDVHRSAADHVVRVGQEDAGGALLAYHLLWELAHVVFEHPGLLPEPPVAGSDDVCITCSDEGRVVEVRAVLDPRTALVRAAGNDERVDISVVDEVAPGDLLLVHAGLALSIVAGASAGASDHGGHRP